MQEKRAWTHRVKPFENAECTINGKTKTLAQWAREVGLTNDTIRARLMHGWSAHEAFTLPLNWRR